MSRLADLLAHPVDGLSVNVSPPERVLSAAVGAALVAAGAVRRRPAGALLASLGAGLVARGATGHCPAYAAAGQTTAARTSATVRSAMTINLPRAEVFAAWSRLDTLAEAMQHLDSVEALGEGRTRWSAKGPGGVGTLTWVSEETAHEAPVELAWRTVEGDLDHTGRVTFADAPQGGTEVRVEWRYLLPPGTGAASGLFTDAFEKMLRNDLNRFRALVEAGEVPTVDGQPKGEWQVGRPVVFPTSPV